MIGNLNKKIFFLILLIPLLFSCGNVETDNEIGRYKVIERKEIQRYGSIHTEHQKDLHDHQYYLLDTKTGEIKK